MGLRMLFLWGSREGRKVEVGAIGREEGIGGFRLGVSDGL